ncbi:hypothetical protein VNO77_10400 [Canavalia gladiata]|uniref:Uncharacterized protein n=1 Tax=Canavalia gladiata TaxID=3824 RepID=A0AAN9MAC9_CANGL
MKNITVMCIGVTAGHSGIQTHRASFFCIHFVIRASARQQADFVSSQELGIMPLLQRLLLAKYQKAKFEYG